jgi:hypothetical protein
MENTMTFAALEIEIKRTVAWNTAWTGIGALACLRLLSQSAKAVS